MTPCVNAASFWADRVIRSKSVMTTPMESRPYCSISPIVSPNFTPNPAISRAISSVLTFILFANPSTTSPKDIFAAFSLMTVAS